jgi:hypothetical protein
MAVSLIADNFKRTLSWGLIKGLSRKHLSGEGFIFFEDAISGGYQVFGGAQEVDAG